MDSSTGDPNELLQAARTGDAHALGALLEHYRPMLYRNAHKNLDHALRGRLSASDIVNMTALSTFKGFPKFEGDLAAFVSMIRTIQQRNLIDEANRIRAPIRDPRREVSAIAAENVADSGIKSPSQILGDEEQTERLEAALRQLPAAQAEAIRLRYFDRLSVGEIMERLNRSETAVAGLIKRGVRRLRELLGEPTTQGRD